MTMLSGVFVIAAIAAIAGLYFVLRRKPSDIWEWSDSAYEPRREEVRDTPRALTRIRSKDIQWEIQP